MAGELAPYDCICRVIIDYLHTPLFSFSKRSSGNRDLFDGANYWYGWLYRNHVIHVSLFGFTGAFFGRAVPVYKQDKGGAWVPYLVHNLCASHVESDGCFHCRRLPAFFRWWIMLATSCNRRAQWIFQRYLTPRQKAGGTRANEDRERLVLLLCSGWGTWTCQLSPGDHHQAGLLTLLTTDEGFFLPWHSFMMQFPAIGNLIQSHSRFSRTYWMRIWSYFFLPFAAA